jgi:hypothetical protein
MILCHFKGLLLRKSDWRNDAATRLSNHTLTGFGRNASFPSSTPLPSYHAALQPAA